MRKLFIIFVAISQIVSAQQLTVEKMIAAPMDLSASQYERKDLNGEACALVKVQFAAVDAQFEGNVIGKTEYKTGEYWVYMTEGSYMLSVKHPSFVPLNVNFRDYSINGVAGKNTYIITLLMPQEQKEKIQKLIVNYTPNNAIVVVDSKSYQGNGHLELMLPIGTHEYQIVAMGYDSVEGSVKLNTNSPRTITENLTATQQTANQTEQTIPIVKETDAKPTDDPRIAKKDNDDIKKEVLEYFVSKFCGIYNVELSKTNMSEIEALYGVKQVKDEDHYEICIKDDTEFKDILDNGKCNMLCIDPRKTPKAFPDIDNLSWKSSYTEWNEWFTSHGFEETPYDPYFGKQAMLTYVNGDLNVILMFDGRKNSHGTWFSLIISKEPK